LPGTDLDSRFERGMNALHSWMRWGVWLFTVGGALWVLKVVFIALNDAMDRNVDAFPVPLFYIGALLFMVLGATGVGIAFVRNSVWWVQLLCAVAGVIGFFLLYAVLDGVLKAAFGDAGPSWLEDELGIVSTGAVCFAVGLLLARRIAAREPRQPASRAL
jgi:hypothetical protein